jgi:predicted dehydrogenase/threonine dehydrogenase-like Zn-dependent dehydrogenase
MKQVVQYNNTGQIVLRDVPVPIVMSRALLVRTTASVVSAGTERHIVEFAKKSLLGKALARPDLVRKVVAVAKTEGVAEAYRAAASRLDIPTPMGYSSAGRVIAVGEGVQGFKTGDRVACAGSTYACHAEVISMPRTLCVPIPDGVDDESAAFVALGGISLHAARVSEAVLGETVAVIGLGLLGLLAVQILKASGCHVLGMDPNPARCQIARELGCDATASVGDTMQSLVANHTSLHGCDAVIIFAATSSSQPVELAAEIARDQGRVVVPGLVGLDIPRKTFYEKELDLRISRAWGPGLYDLNYEAGKTDYPYPFVRWTAQRNMAAFLDLIAQGRVSVDRLITHRFTIEKAMEAYQLVTGGKEPYIGVLLTYPESNVTVHPSRTIWLDKQKDVQRSKLNVQRSNLQPAIVGFIGAGNFARATLLPAIRRLKGVKLRGLTDISGVNARHVGEKYGFNFCTTDYHELLGDPEINAIMIATPHNSHAPLVVEALRAGKHVYVEKPLAINIEQLRQVIKTFNFSLPSEQNLQPSSLQLMVGFNRRFSPFTIALKDWLAFTDLPMVINCRVNAGFVPPNRWEQDPQIGGGRIIGEVCHFVDLIQYLTDADPVQVCAQTMKAAGQYLSQDNLVITLNMSDGSVGTITYTASGDKAFPRERVEVFRGGAGGLIDNFRSATFIYQGRKRRNKKWFGIDRGHRAELAAFFSSFQTGSSSPVAFKSYVLATLTTFAIVESMQNSQPVGVDVRPDFVIGKGE